LKKKKKDKEDMSNKKEKDKEDMSNKKENLDSE